MNAVTVTTVDYAGSAKRHYIDASSLHSSGRPDNAGQLYGFAAECGVKALLVASGVSTDAQGSITRSSSMRLHAPVLFDSIVAKGHLIPDGRMVSNYMAMLPGLQALHDWSTDHRYWRDGAFPATSLLAWQQAAAEVLRMVDTAKNDGVLE